MLENEPKPVEEAVPSAENVGQEPAQSEPQVAAENKPAEVAEVVPADAEKPAESVGVNVEQPPPPAAEGDAKPVATEITEKIKDSLDVAIDGEGSDTAIDSDSDFDIMEEIDPSYAIDVSLWKKVADFSECDLKPEKKDTNPENADKKESKRERAEEAPAEEEEDSGFSEVIIRSEKDRDAEFREYIFELCRPKIISYFPDRVAASGTDVRLTCTVQGNNIQTRWLKDDEVLNRGKNIQTKTDGEIYTLEISNITEKDAGVYTAEFKNRAGEVTTSSRIRVFDGKLHKPDHIDIALVKGKLQFNLFSILVQPDFAKINLD